MAQNMSLVTIQFKCTCEPSYVYAILHILDSLCYRIPVTTDFDQIFSLSWVTDSSQPSGLPHLMNDLLQLFVLLIIVNRYFTGDSSVKSLMYDTS